MYEERIFLTIGYCKGGSIALGQVKFLKRRGAHLDFYIAPHNLRGENLKFMKS
jgi:hypothetical protein